MSLVFIHSTRGGRTAIVQIIPREQIRSHSLIGRIDGKDLELWKADGAWRDDGTPHPKDLLIEATDPIKKILTHNL